MILELPGRFFIYGNTCGGEQKRRGIGAETKRKEEFSPTDSQKIPAGQSKLNCQLLPFQQRSTQVPPIHKQ